MRLLFLSAGLLGLLAAALAINVALLRGRKRIFLGDGGDKEMLSAMRAHANFIEFVPLTLLLIFVVMDHYGGKTSGIMAGLLLVFRLFHAGGMLGFIKFGRTIGATGTLIVLLAASVLIVLYALGAKPF